MPEFRVRGLRNGKSDGNRMISSDNHTCNLWAGYKPTHTLLVLAVDISYADDFFYDWNTALVQRREEKGTQCSAFIILSELRRTTDNSHISCTYCF